MEATHKEPTKMLQIFPSRHATSWHKSLSHKLSFYWTFAQFFLFLSFPSKYFIRNLFYVSKCICKDAVFFFFLNPVPLGEELVVLISMQCHETMTLLQHCLYLLCLREPLLHGPSARKPSSASWCSDTFFTGTLFSPHLPRFHHLIRIKWLWKGQMNPEQKSMPLFRWCPGKY